MAATAPKIGRPSGVSGNNVTPAMATTLRRRKTEFRAMTNQRPKGLKGRMRATMVTTEHARKTNGTQACVHEPSGSFTKAVKVSAATMAWEINAATFMTPNEPS
jgi:hypothetical protein